jgi:transcriptional regulator with XRE-family HTH domain
MTAPDADLAARIREAREYLGLSTAQAAERLRCAAMLLEAVEAGTADPGPEFLAKLGKLYMRPVEWFTGGWRFEPSPGLLRMAEGVRHPGDREAVLDFAEFLQCKKETETRA